MPPQQFLMESNDFSLLIVDVVNCDDSLYEASLS